MKTIQLLCLSLTILVTSLSLSAQNGLNFDGTNDYIQTTSPGVLGTANRTLEAWIFLSSNPTANIAIMDYGLNAVGSRNTFAVNANEGLTYISGGSNANIGSTTGVVPIGQWTHVAMVLKNGDGFLYVNGVEVGTGLLTTVNTPGTGSDIRIGQRVSGGNIPFEGVIDEVRVWNEAKTPAELMANMNTEFCEIPIDLVAYYKLNEGVAGGTNTTITTTVDEVAGANGTLTNFALTGASSNWVTGQTLPLASIVLNQSFNECSGFSVTVGTNTYDSTGSYIDTLLGASSAGCDSIVNTTLTVAPEVTFNQSFTECAGFSVIVGSNTYDSTGAYIDTFSGAASGGCDSIVNTMITVNPIVTFDQTFDECFGFAISVGTNTYSVTGMYADTLVGASSTACDSIVNTNLTVAAAIDKTVVNNSPDLTANQTGADYQWLDCNDNFASISGANSQMYAATANGSYAVEITIGNCVDTSNCETVTGVRIIEDNFGSELMLHPNPTQGNFSIDLGELYQTVTISITDLTGRQLLSYNYKESRFLDLTIEEPAGVYILLIESGDKQAIIRLINE